MTQHTTRRAFIKGGTALMIGLNAMGALAASPEGYVVIPAMATSRTTAMADAGTVINPFLKFHLDGSITAIIKHFEMGQGTTTGLATLIAEEAGIAWEDVKTEYAPSSPTYKNLAFGMQGTGGSTALANSWQQYREAGAALRAMITEVAAEQLAMPASQLRVQGGWVRGGNRRLAVRDLAAAVSTRTPPAKPQLKDAADFTFIGNAGLRRLDGTSKTNGTATFAMDIKVPGMVYAVIKRPPKFGGKVRDFDASATRAVNGVVDVKQIPQGVVVYAGSSWAAIKGRDALQVDWDFSGAETRSTEEMIADYRDALQEPGITARPGAPDFDGAEMVEAEFVFPFLAHAPMEPLNCVIEPTAEGGYVVHDGCQFPALAHPTMAGILGVPPEKVSINTVLAGGSFGRRATPTSDYHAEAAFAAKALGGKTPVKLFWTREDDITGGYFRPLFVHTAKAGIRNGEISGWDHRIAGQSFSAGTPFEPMMIHNGVDHSAVEGAANTPYDIPGLTVGAQIMPGPVTTLWWRSVGHTHTAFAMEVMMDMLAEKAGADPFAFRLAHLAGESDDHRRLRGVLTHLRDRLPAMPKGGGRGIAVQKSFNSYVAEAVDISLHNGAVKVDHVYAAVDCGVAVNPDIVRAQVEGGVGFGLGAAMRNQITFDGGEVVEQNFPDYEPLRISDMPHVETFIIASSEAPTGIGEPGVPPIAPALSNAIYAATGVRHTKLPFTAYGIEFA